MTKDLHRIPLRDLQRLEQRGHRMAQIMKPDLPQACSIDQPLERADEVAGLDRPTRAGARSARRRSTSPNEINDAVKRAAEQQLKGILGTTERPNVSIDFNHDARSSIVHLDQTKVMDGTLVRVMSWYDNEWGFSCRMADTAVAMGKIG